MVWTTARITRANSQHPCTNTKIVSWWQNSKGGVLRCGNGMSQKDGIAHLKVNIHKKILANAYRTNRLQDAQSLNNTKIQVALLLGSLFLIGLTSFVSLNQRENQIYFVPLQRLC